MKRILLLLPSPSSVESLLLRRWNYTSLNSISNSSSPHLKSTGQINSEGLFGSWIKRNNCTQSSKPSQSSSGHKTNENQSQNTSSTSSSTSSSDSFSKQEQFRLNLQKLNKQRNQNQSNTNALAIGIGSVGAINVYLFLSSIIPTNNNNNK